MSTKTLVKVALLGVISFILMLFEAPIPFFPSFLKLDVSDLPAIIGAFALGPVPAILVALVKNVLHLITGSTTGGIGELSNFVIASAYVLPAGLLYKTMHSKKGAILGCLLGTFCMTFVGAFSNYFVMLPFYSNIMPIEAIIATGAAVNGFIHDKFTLVLYGVLPFNLFKGIFLSIVTAIVYKPLSPILKRK